MIKGYYEIIKSSESLGLKADPDDQIEIETWLKANF